MGPNIGLYETIWTKSHSEEMLTESNEHLGEMITGANQHQKNKGYLGQMGAGGHGHWSRWALEQTGT